MGQQPGSGRWLSWREATERALYGDGGFYRQAGATRHYRTSVMVSPRFAEAILELLLDVDAALGHPDPLDVVDVGAGSGQLIDDLARCCPAELLARLRLTAVDLGPRPEGLTPQIGWTPTLPSTVDGLMVANEWLDNVPLDVVELTDTGPRLVLVDPETGAEQLGPPPEAADLAWLDRWWPLDSVGQRAELGRPRDRAWAAVLRRLARGLAVTADYAHQSAARPAQGTLTGYRDGRVVPPVPDGSCDVTAHVALDSCAAAGTAAGATSTVLTTQRTALRALGVLGNRPPIGLATTDPARYLRELQRAGTEGELIERTGLGAFGWLIQSVGDYLPAAAGAMLDR